MLFFSHGKYSVNATNDTIPNLQIIAKAITQKPNIFQSRVGDI
jgi:hypothetical protein